MTSFSERHAPPPRSLGPEIPAGVRRAIDLWLVDEGVDPDEIRRRIFQRAGYADVSDVVDDVRDRWDDLQAAVLLRLLAEDPDVARWEIGSRSQRDAATKLVFHHIPEPLYLDYLEEAIAKHVRDRSFVVDPSYLDYVEDPRVAPVRYLNELFARRGIDYRFNEDGRAEWHGDEGAYTEVVRPALDALDDERLQTARRECGDSLVGLRRGDRVGNKNAIRDASNAVESTMKALLDAHGIPRPEKEAADSLWDALRDGGIVAERTKEEVCGPSHLGNRYARHGPDPADDQPIPPGVATLAVQTAAAAIVYLASLLP